MRAPLPPAPRAACGWRDDGRFRLELQSDAGDAQIASDGKHAERLRRDRRRPSTASRSRRAARRGRPTREPADARRRSDAGSTASPARGRCRARKPTSTAGRPTYTVRIAPKDDGGLLGAGELAWDAVKGVPLRAAVYAQDQAEPVLELEATDVSFGRGPRRRPAASPCPPARGPSTSTRPPAARRTTSRRAPDVEGVEAVQRELDFQLAAPDELAGLPAPGGPARAARRRRRRAERVRRGPRRRSSCSSTRPAGDQRRRRRGGSGLPQVNIDGATGTELATALGTIVTFERGGVSYTVLGSVPPAAVENAARGLR